MPVLIDLSHVLEPGMPSYPGLPAPRFGTFLTHAQCAERGSYSPGTTFQMATLELIGNTGTYVDAPFHRHLSGTDLAALPLDRLAHLPGVAIPAPPPAGTDRWAIVPETLAGVRVRNKAVLLRTGWSERWGADGYFKTGPFVTRECAQMLVDAGALLAGIDCANIDDMSDPTRPAHTILLAAGIPIVEHLRGLDQLPPTGFRFSAVPPAIRGGTSFPVRAYATIGR